MRLAVLVTNTDFSAFSQARPDDAQKFADMIGSVRPDWICTPFWVCKDAFPEDLSGFDGVMVTGSPASVHDKAPWIARLEALVRALVAAQTPLFGACFGHQVIAKALGAQIVRNPDGWGHGLVPVIRKARAPWSGPEPRLALYASHIEQVAAAPPGAEVLFAGPGVPVAGYRIGGHVFTIQHHPEMSAAFFADLVEELAGYVGPDATAAARASLSRSADGPAMAAEIARFFEAGGA